MDNLPTKDEAVYMILGDILEHETSPEAAEFLCIALLAGFRKIDDLTNVVQRSENQPDTIGKVKAATALMSYDRTNPDQY